MSQGDEEFDGADDEFEEACADESASGAARVEESAARERLKRVGNMAGYVTGDANEPEEEEEEKNVTGNCKQPARNPVGGSHVW